MRISAEELAEYTVCPEAWRLRRSLRKGVKGLDLELNERSLQGISAKGDWLAGVKESSVISKYQRIIFLTMLALTTVVFIIEARHPGGKSWMNLTKTTGYSVPEELVYLLLMFGVIVTFWRILIYKRDSLIKKTGMTGDGEKSTDFFSKKIGLTSNPDSVTLENGRRIPVDVYPLAKKVRDRHITRLIGHLVILKDLDSQSPQTSAYGILLMGAEKRVVKISLNLRREEEFFMKLAELKSSIQSESVIPSPDYYKCRNCDFYKVCKFATLPREKY